ncbi:TonB-dependent receptor [Sandarakinorhabdus sp. AAP62]|uniref:TonB-dependent siderophore receptor n=1 Tax=Sandarakinorhabdus sp. AAP62 TaxID=1248916 RepID=UPI0002F941DD|nr:TonB-dependent receptor [Sandarakinorhabdus sp. AAP62]
MKLIRRVLLATVATTGFLGASAQAQVAEAADTGAEDIEIVVTGVVSSAGQNKIDSSISVSSLGAEAIAATNPTNLAEVFRQLPGIRSESSSGGGNSNINVRGIPISTGGAKFLSMQEDGLPILLFGDHLFAPADGFFKADATLARVESVRGGTASTLTTNGPGGIINLIGKTGKTEGGSVAFRAGVDYRDYRVDAEYGARLADDLYFHLGGHFQQGGDFRNSGYSPVSGGQIRLSLTKEFDAGYVRVIGKIIDKKEQAYFPQLVSRTGDANSGVVGTSLGGFSAANHSLYSPFTRNGLAVNGRNQLEPYDVADGLNHKVRSIGLETKFDLGSGIELQTKTRYQDISGEFLGFFTYGALNAASLAGSTYFNGPQAGAAVTAANLPNGFASEVAVFDVNLDDLSNFANDVRLSKTFEAGGDTTVDLAVGHFFMHQNFKQDWHWTRLVTTTENNAALINVPGSINGIAGVNQAFGWDGSNRNYDLEAETSSPFAAVAVKTGNLSLDASMRYDFMRQNGVRTAGAGAPFDVNGDGRITGSEATVSLNTGVVDARANLRADNFAWSIGANYLIGDNLSVFGRASSGASFNFDRALDFGVRDASGGLLAGAEGAYVDKVKQYEIGFKAQNLKLGGGELDLYGTLFLSETEESNITITPPTGQIRKYEAKGLELEAYYKSGVFNLYATATYTDAEISDARNSANVVNNALIGNRPQRQARLIWAVTPSLNFDRVRLSASWIGTGDSFANDANTLTQKGYSVVHLTGAVNITDNLEFSLNVNNLFDKAGITESANDGRESLFAGAPNTVTIGRSIMGRTMAANIRFTF